MLRPRYLPRAMATIRTAVKSDQDALGRYGGALMRQHHDADPRRFIQVEHPEAGYGRYLVSQIGVSDTLVLVAESAGQVVGYVYADLEDIDWKDLRGPCGYVHDVYVDEEARGQGAGRALMRAALEWFHAQGATQAVLLTKTGNHHAQQLFASLGFRPTMTEMTLDWDAAPPAPERGARARDGAGAGEKP